MPDFPASTYFGKKVPKNRFYASANFPPDLKRAFSAEIGHIIWLRKFSPDTLAIAPGSEVAEIELLQINLNQARLSRKALQAIARAIPYHLIFLLAAPNLCQLCACPATSGAAWHESAWLAEEELRLEIRGLNMDEVYENFVRQIAGYAPGAPLARMEELMREKMAAQREIEKLGRKMAAERQFKYQVEINRKLRAARQNLAALNEEIEAYNGKA